MLNSRFLGKIFSFFLAVSLVLTGVLGTTGANQAFAESLTPEASAYEVDRATTPEMAQRRNQETARRNLKELAGEEIPHQSSSAKQSVKNGGEETRGSLQQAADSVREKLNLDEPIPQTTKDFLSNVQEKVGLD